MLNSSSLFFFHVTCWQHESVYLLHCSFWSHLFLPTWLCSPSFSVSSQCKVEQARNIWWGHLKLWRSLLPGHSLILCPARFFILFFFHCKPNQHMWRTVNFNLVLIQHFIFCLFSVQFSQCKQITIIQRIHLSEKTHLLAGLLLRETVERQTGDNNLPFIIDKIFTLNDTVGLGYFPFDLISHLVSELKESCAWYPWDATGEMLISSGVDFLAARKSNLQHWSRNMVLPELHVFLAVWISLKLGSRVGWTGLWNDTFPYRYICNYIHLLNNWFNRALASVSTRWPEWLGSPFMPADLLESVGSTLRNIKACLLPGHLCEHARTRKAENTQSNHRLALVVAVGASERVDNE